MQLNMYPYEYCATDFVMKAKECLAFYGTKDTHLADILTLLIGNEANSSNIQKLLNIGLGRLSEMSLTEIMEEASISEMAAQRIIAAFGLAHQYITSPPKRRDVIRLPIDAADILMPEMRFLTQEHFVCLFLNTKNRVVGKKTIFIGGLDAALVHPREIFKEAIMRSAASVICVHNHPSGDPTPSREDIEMTLRLEEAGQLIGIELMDHIIIGDGNFISLKEKGYI